MKYLLIFSSLLFFLAGRYFVPSENQTLDKQSICLESKNELRLEVQSLQKEIDDLEKKKGASVSKVNKIYEKMLKLNANIHWATSRK